MKPTSALSLLRNLTGARRPLDRRAFLQLAGSAGAATLLSACERAGTQTPQSGGGTSVAPEPVTMAKFP
jgi:hypothetical protein